MAAFEYTCVKDCGGSVMVFAKVDEKRPKWKKCPKCGSRSTRHFRAPQLSIFKPYVTPDITGTEVEITSPSQEARLCKKHGVERLTSDDKTGSPEAMRRNKAKRFNNQIAALGDFEGQYHAKMAVSVRSRD